MKPVGILIFLFFCFLSESIAQITLNPVPTRAIGQDSARITNLNPNLVEGREFDTPEGLALDTLHQSPRPLRERFCQ